MVLQKLIPSFSSLAMILLVIAVPTRSARAGLEYGIGFDQAEYNVLPGATAEVKVIFREIRDGADVAKLAIGGSDGLFASGFVLNYGGGDNALTFNSATLNSSASGFDPAFTTFVSNLAARTYQLDPQARDFTNGIEVIPSIVNGKDVFEVEIATFVFRNDGNLTSKTILSLSQTLTPFGVLFADGTEPANIQFQSALFGSVTSVPEPTSMTLVGIACTLGFAGYRRKKRGLH